MKINRPNDTEFENCPADQHQAVLVDVLDFGWEMKVYQGQDKGMFPKTQFVFQVDALMDNGERFQVRSFPMFISWHEKANFYQFLKDLLGIKPLEKILESGEFDPDSLIGLNALLKVDHVVVKKDGQEKVYANITNVMPWNRKMGEPIDPLNYDRKKDRPGYQAPVPSAFEDYDEGIAPPEPQEASARKGVAKPPWTRNESGADPRASNQLNQNAHAKQYAKNLVANESGDDNGWDFTQDIEQAQNDGALPLDAPKDKQLNTAHA